MVCPCIQRIRVQGMLDWCEVWVGAVLLVCVCAGRKTLVLLGDFNMAPDKEGWCACVCDICTLVTPEPSYED